MNRFAKWMIPALGMALLAGGVHVAGQPSPPADSAKDDFRGLTAAEVQALQRRITRTILEAGVVESTSVVELHSRLPGEAVVLSIVPDGSSVKQGDLLIEFDDSRFREELFKQRIVVDKSRAGVEAAMAEVEAGKQRATAELATAELELKVAELARSRYLDKGGELENNLARADREIEIAEERVKTALLQMPAGDDNADDRQVDVAARLAVTEARAELEAAQAAKQLLNRHIRGHRTAALELGVLQARTNLQQQRLTTAAAIRQSETALQVQEEQSKAEQSRLERIQEQLRQCRIVAPQDGMVVHATPIGRRTAASALEPGATVRERQLLLKMPDLDRLHVRVNVHESQVGRVKVGQQATLRLDAFPARKFAGTVAAISRTPEPRDWLSQNVVEYSVLVKVTEPPQGMKLGMTVAAEIDVAADGDR